MKKTYLSIYKSAFYWTLLLFLGSNSAFAGTIWSNANSNQQLVERSAIPTQQQKLFQIDLSEIKSQLATSAKEFTNSSTLVLELPLPDGSFEDFYVYESSIMEAELAAKFPSIRTYSVQSVHQSNISGRIDIGPKGFHAILFTENGTVYIDPLNKNTLDVAQVYYKKHFIPNSKATAGSCTLLGEDGEMAKKISSLAKKGIARPSGDELRTYRLAVGATGEYTTFHGGTVQEGLAAIVTTINRVVGIYEREVAIRMILVANNDQIIYTDADTDPFTNNNTGTLINQSQNVCDNIIGSANYDVGHTFSTGAGGLASLGVPCVNGAKGRGVTGITQPIGDPFDVDFVAHELGHQFGGGHTFNGTTGSCGGNGGAGYEPGSGTTIMAYAGICGAQNIQNNSDDYFVGFSYDQIIAYSTLSNGNDCAVITATGNTAPEVGVLESGFTIPNGTPFELTGNATDADGDDLTYQWEQFDIGPSGAPNSPSGNAAIFRSFLPTTSTTRVFPQISDIVNNTQTQGEILPSYARNLKMRFNARDNRPGGGGVDHDFIDLTVDGNAGPFLVTVPNTNVSYEVNENVNVTWDVAGTNGAAVNCQSVSIYLSTDGGFTYPITLLSSTLNDGSATVTIPNEITNTARIKVKASDNVFFDISNTNFSIVEPSSPDIYVNVEDRTKVICTPNDAIYDINVEQLGGFSSTVLLEITNLPAGATAVFSNNNFVPTQSSELTIGNTASLANGAYTLDLQISGNGITRNTALELEIFNGAPNAINVISPADAATAQSLLPLFSWEADPSATSYDFELAAEASFTTILDASNIVSNSYTSEYTLEPTTSYFWRVSGKNVCGSSSNSTTYSFTTDALSCNTFSAEDLPIIITSFGPNTATSIIPITSNSVIMDLNVLNLQGNHTWIADLDATLKSPNGTIVELFTSPCDNEDNWNINFDDAATSATLPCPLTDGNTYQPKGSLANFVGENSIGDWELSIIDNFNQDGGQFTSWSLEICQLASTDVPTQNPPSNLTATAISNAQIDLEWTDNSDNETGFIIERSLTSGSGFSELTALAANTTTYSDMGLNSNTTYFYRIKAIDNIVSSIFSNEANATTFDLIPTIATNLIATTVSTSSIDLQWTDNSENELGFIIDRASPNNSNYNTIDTVGANVSTYRDNGLNSGIYYFYKVAAYNAVGNSQYSEEDSALTDIETAIIDFLLDNSTTIFPNPASDFVHVLIQHNEAGSLELSVYDVSGKIVITEYFEKTTLEFSERLDINELENGMYLLKIRLKDALIHRKIQKH